MKHSVEMNARNCIFYYTHIVFSFVKTVNVVSVGDFMNFFNVYTCMDSQSVYEYIGKTHDTQTLTQAPSSLFLALLFNGNMRTCPLFGKAKSEYYAIVSREICDIISVVAIGS